MIANRLAALREEMKKRKIDMYIVPTSDFHESEYVGDYFKARQFMTGFTGSAGTAVITMEQAGLWTDGRYFIQAAAQLAGSTVALYRMGEEGVPTIKEYAEKMLKEGGCIGFDGRVVNTKLGEEFLEIAKKKNGSIYAKEDLVDLIWKERPSLPMKPVYVLDKKYAGEDVASKLKKVREEMKKQQADVHILTSLYDIAWLFNIRGGDIECVPVVLSFAVMTQEQCTLYIHEQTLDQKVWDHLQKNHITIKAYEEIYKDIAQLSAEQKIMLDKSVVNYRIWDSLPTHETIVESPNPTEQLKAIKNKTELENTLQAHIKDGVAVTKFIYWLKTNIKKKEITELDAQEYIDNLRRAQKDFLDLSFTTISAYGANAAMMHYSATPETNAILKPNGFLLVDSGGHYLQGTTDITRTICLGPISAQAKKHFTAVCCANMSLANAKFLYGCTGANLDILARGPLWQMGMDYKCGTGHGVGHILNVHEGPNAFRWKMTNQTTQAVLEEGMITTDEPGVYIEGEYGIRTENELVCCKAEKNEYGQFMRFENITFAPIDLDAIDPEQMNIQERRWLNEYHKNVYETISPYLDNNEKEWLKEYTRVI